MTPSFRSFQVRVFTLTWLSYASYYLCRKHFWVVKSTLATDLHIDIEVLGIIDSLYLGMYALGQFVNGALGDRVGARRMIAFGMMATAGLGFVMGLGETALLFIIAFGLNGLAQSTGWPNNVKAMGPWFGSAERGRVMGLWCTNYQVGGLVATALATFLLANIGWRAAFMVPSVWVAGVGAIILVYLAEKPQDKGFPPVDGTSDVAAPRAPFREMLKIPALWMLGSSYFGLKLIRYSLLAWLPYYLEKGLDYSAEAAGYMSTSFEAGGIVGVILVGYLSDRYAHFNRARLISPILFALAAALFLYQYVGETGMVANGLSMALVGFMLFGPDALISGAAAQDVGGPHATGSAAGIINGLGSIGAILSGVVTAWISKAYGWQTLFYVFIGFALLSAFILLPLALKGAESPVTSD